MIHRRHWMQSMLACGVGMGASRCLWARPIADAMMRTDASRHLVILWMAGGPSQMDTFDMKPGTANGGEFREIATSVPGIRISEHLPKIAKWMDHLAIVRNLQTKEGDHGRGTFLVRTGQRPGAPLKYPSFPVALAKELSPSDPMIPDYVSIAPQIAINPAAFGSGFLGPRYQPLTVGAQTAFNPQPNARPVDLRVDNLLPASDLASERIRRRREMWEMLQENYGIAERDGAPKAHDTVFRRAMKLSDSELNVAFDLTKEATEVRDRFGPSTFGQGCLMARRLIERGVPVVEVTLGEAGLAWDTHANNFQSVKNLSAQLDAGWSSLMEDLSDRGLLESTTFLWIGEFGRTPAINPQGGRDHFPDAWSCVVGGGNIAGGQVLGATSPDGTKVEGDPTSIPEILATISTATGVNPATENTSELGRPIKIVDAKPLKTLLTS